MKPRVTGLEAEHAILFRPQDSSGASPSRREVYELLEARIALRYPHLPSGLVKQGIFLPCGGVVQYEALPPRESEGLLEIATPECRDPLDTALYHRALEDLATSVLPEVEEVLATRGYTGTVALGKNCLDYKGNFYGAHENYDVEDALAPWFRPLAALYVGLVWLPAAIPMAAAILAGLVSLAASLTFAVIMLLLTVGGWLPLVGYRVKRIRDSYRRLVRALGAKVASGLQWILDHFAMRLMVLWNRYLIGCLRPVFLRRFQRDLTGFMVSRTLFSGAGAVADDGSLHLSQRAEVIGKVAGIFVNDGARPILDLRDLHWPPHAALSRRKRLHVLVGDSNMNDFATYLKVGTTQLVLDVIESGAELAGVQLAEPIAALQAISRGGGADVKLALAGGGETTAIALQRRYLAAAQAHFGDPAPDHRTQDLLQRWGAVLDALETNPRSLHREIDWVAKAKLMAQSDARESLPGIMSPDTLERHRKIDLRYHELGREGYFAQLENGGLVSRLFTPAEIAAAWETPPRGTRAHARGELVRRYGHLRGDLAAGWSRVAGHDPIELDVALDDPYSEALPANLPEAPDGAPGAAAGLERVAGQLPILPGGTGRSTSVVTGYYPTLLLLLFGADVAVSLSLPEPGGGTWLVALVGFLGLAPLVAVSLVALLRHATRRGAFNLEDVVAAALNAAILNLALVVVSRLLFGLPAIW